MKPFLCFLFGIICLNIQGQFRDSFDDGELLNNPTWAYNTANFDVVGGRLHTTNNAGGSVQYGISAPTNTGAYSHFYFDIEMGVNPSSTNYIDVYLSADTLAELSKNGYFVRFGNTKDEISLYKNTNGTLTEIISGTDGELNKTSNHYSIKVVKNSNWQWELSYAVYGTQSFSIQGTAVDSTWKTSKYAGVKIVQNGTTVIGKHYLDNFWFGIPKPDVIAPKMSKATFIFPDKVAVTFNENIGNYAAGQFALNGTVAPISAVKNSSNPSQIELQFGTVLNTNTTYFLQNTGTEDVSGNASVLHQISFFTPYVQKAAFGDIIFTEIMANPTPSVGTLPEAEYVEIKNTTAKYLRLAGLFFADASSKVALPDSILAPYSYAVVTRNTNIGLQAPNRHWVGCGSFPSLNNDGDFISITDSAGNRIQALQYSINWHSDGLKKSGGWSLELIDTAYACVTNGNWSSNTTAGGSPGEKNSILGNIQSLPTFEVLRIYPVAPNTLRIYCNLPADSMALRSSHFNIEPGNLSVNRINNFDLQRNSFDVVLNSNLAINTAYTLNIDSLFACYGAVITNQKINTGIGYRSIPAGALLLNELLFDPKGEGADYVEIYNNTDSILDLGSTWIVNFDDQGQPDKAYLMAPDGYTLFPGELVAVTENPLQVMQQYKSHRKATILEITTLPTYPNDKGHCGLVNNLGQVIDRFSYDDNMHSPVIDDKDGISLEKIIVGAPSMQLDKWTSAAESAGFGTPGLPNSQLSTAAANGTFSMPQSWFTPNNDGNNDYLSIQYQLPEAGYFISVRIFTESGVLMAQPYSNYYTEQHGTCIWTGDDIEGMPLSPGNYAIHIEAYHANGKRLHKTLTCSILAQ